MALNDCVEPIDVSVNQAFGQFKNKVINANDVGKYTAKLQYMKKRNSIDLTLLCL